MEIELLDGKATRRAITRLSDDYDEFYWVVAWGTISTHGKRLLEHKRKFRSVTFGVAFSQTDPDLIDALVGVKGACVVTAFSGGTFHPKLYCFRSGGQMAAIVGSPNFTNGGLGNNLEAAVLVTGDSKDDFFRELLDFIKESASHGRAVTQEYAAAYRASCIRASRLEKPPRDPVPQDDRSAVKRMITPLVGTSWDEYVSKVRSSAHHDVEKSLGLLRVAQEWIASVRSFAHLNTPQRKAIAGTLGDYQKTTPALSLEWGWFGSMRGMGDFANRIDENDPFIARGLDSIPRHGNVTEDQYDRFVENFARAFDKSHRLGGVPTASRLLAMKRPDTFLCVCGPNIAQASEALGFSRTTLDLGNYWDRVVEPLRLCDWYNTPRPTDSSAELWDGRAAMLDAIFYRP